MQAADTNGTLQVVDQLLVNVQKARSSLAESAGISGSADQDPLLVSLNPWLFGVNSILPRLLEISERGQCSASELMNLLVIAHRLEPAIALTAALRGDDLPEPTDAFALARSFAH